MTFPAINSNEVKEIKSELTKLKTTLFVSEQNILVSKMTDIARFMGFSLTVLDVDALLKKKEYEFEYDLIFARYRKPRRPRQSYGQSGVTIFIH